MFARHEDDEGAGQHYEGKRALVEEGMEGRAARKVVDDVGQEERSRDENRRDPRVDPPVVHFADADSQHDHPTEDRREGP